MDKTKFMLQGYLISRNLKSEPINENNNNSYAYSLGGKKIYIEKIYLIPELALT